MHTRRSANKSRNLHQGLTLTEVMIAMVIFVILAGGIIGAVFTVRADAENNLYESAALNVAISFLEQLKSIETEALLNPPVNGTGEKYHTFLIGFGQSFNMPLSKDTAVMVPIISNADGTAKKELEVIINMQVDEATDFDGFWFEVDYTWKHPTTKKEYSGEVRSFNCEKVATY